MATLTSPGIEELIADVRNMLNQPSAANSFWTDEELTVYLNEAVRRYFTEVVHHAEGEFMATADLDITSGADTVPLPSDFFKIKALYRKVSGGYRVLAYKNEINYDYSTQGTSSGDTYLPWYYLRGNSVVLRDPPLFTETGGLHLEYVQFPTTMITGGDTLTAQVSPIFKDLIETYAVYKAKLKESLTNGGNTYAPALQNLNDLFIAFKELIQGMSMGPTYVSAFNPED